MKRLILMLVNFMDTLIIPESIEHDPKRIQKIVTEAWKIAIKSNPRKGAYCASSNDDR